VIHHSSRRILKVARRAAPSEFCLKIRREESRVPDASDLGKSG